MIVYVERIFKNKSTLAFKACCISKGTRGWLTDYKA